MGSGFCVVVGFGGEVVVGREWAKRCAKIMIFAHRAEEGDQTQKLYRLQQRRTKNLETDINRIWITTKPCPPPTKTVFGIEKMHQP